MADKRHAYAQFHTGVCYYNGIGVEKNTKETFKYYESAANAGVAEAQFNIGVFYFYGYDIKQDKKRQLVILKKLQRKVLLMHNLILALASLMVMV